MVIKFILQVKIITVLGDITMSNSTHVDHFYINTKRYLKK